MKRLRRWCLYESVLCTLLFDRTYRNHRTAAYVAVWKVINALSLHRPVSRLLCRLGVYTQYRPGVCGWCGERHVKLSKKWAWAVRDTCDPKSPVICIPRGSVS
jgi:hypothetical protein